MEELRRRGISSLEDGLNQTAIQELRTTQGDNIKAAWRERLPEVRDILANVNDENQKELKVESLAIEIGKQLGFKMDYASTDAGAQEFRVVLDMLYQVLEEKE